MNFLYVDPVAFTLFNFEVRWYSICIMIGVAIALFYGIKEGKKLGISSDFIITGLVITLPMAIIGARAWYILFNLDEGISFFGTNGSGMAGLAIQGGVIAAIITVIIYCKVKGESFFKVVDIVAPGFLIGQICGRWGNFFNHELYGNAVSDVDLFLKLLPGFITDNMYIKGGYLLPGLTAGYYHPMFLYESGLNLIGLVIILLMRVKVKKLRSGDLLGLYLIWYGVVRAITESFRFEGEVLMLGNIRVSIAMAIIFVVSGIAYLVIKRFVGPKDGYMDIIDSIRKNNISTILFDNDGTLIDSEEWISRSFIHTFAKYYPDKILTDAELLSFFGPSLHESFSKYEKDEAKITEMIEYYRAFNNAAHDELVKIFPGVIPVLKVLRKKGYNLGIVSAKTRPTIERTLKFFKIDGYFDVIVSGDDTLIHKPDPAGIKKAISVFANPGNVLYVGDHPNDILAGKNAKVQTCAVLYSKRAKEMLSTESDYFINKFVDVLDIVHE